MPWPAILVPSLAALALPVLSALPALAEAPAGPPAEAAANPAPSKKKAARGFKLSTSDGQHTLKVGGSAQVDALVFPGDEERDNTDDIRLRRARIDLRGAIADLFRARLQIDFAASNLQLVDANIELVPSEALFVRIGKDKSPVSFERWQSATAMSFLERGATNQTAPNRDLGIQLVGVVDTLVDYQLGIWAGAPDGATSVEYNADDRFDVAGRVTVAPLAKSKIAALEKLQLGVSFSHGEALGTATATALGNGYRTSGRATWFRYQSGADLASTTVADGARTRLGGHLHWSAGPVSATAEVIASTQRVRLDTSVADLTHVGYSAHATVLLTGDDATWKNVSPRSPVTDGGPGAFELAARIHGIEIDRDAFALGFADPARSARSYAALTAGLTWYLDAQLKAQLNWERSIFEGGAAGLGERGAEDLFGLRVQYLY